MTEIQNSKHLAFDLIWNLMFVICYSRFRPLKVIFLPSIVLKNQRPSAEVAPAPARGHPHTPSSAGGR
jgi:hypothetical protein